MDTMTLSLLLAAAVALPPALWGARQVGRAGVAARKLQALLGETEEGAAPDLQAGVARVGALLQERAQVIDREAERRKALESALCEAEERYSIAVRGASDGLWEWGVKSAKVSVSPRWNAMLGRVDPQPEYGLADWKAMIHPEDLPRVENGLQAVLDGFTTRFESEHRVQHSDGGTRWVLSRATAVRNAMGQAYRVIGVDADITQFKRVESIIMHVAEGTATATGDGFFQCLVRSFAAALGVRMAFITECLDTPATRVRALAFWNGERFVDDVEYDLAGTPCEVVINRGAPQFYPDDLGKRFPKEAELGMSSYYGLPVLDANRQVIGHLAFLDPGRMADDVIVEAIYKIFAARAAAEMERKRVERSVAQLVIGLSQASGVQCFRTLVEHFSSVMQAREAFVTECVSGAVPALRVLAWWRDGRHESDVEYGLAGSICEETIREGKMCVYPERVAELFPRARGLNREAYVGVPCFDSDGEVIGHIACCYDHSLRRGIPDEPVLRLFAERAAIELERRRLALSRDGVHAALR